MNVRPLAILLKCAADSLRKAAYLYQACEEHEEGVVIGGELVKVSPEVKSFGEDVAKRVINEVLQEDLAGVRYVPLPLLVLVGISMIGYAYPRCLMYLQIKKVLNELGAKIIEAVGIEWIDTATIRREVREPRKVDRKLRA